MWLEGTSLDVCLKCLERVCISLLVPPLSTTAISIRYMCVFSTYSDPSSSRPDLSSCAPFASHPNVQTYPLASAHRRAKVYVTLSGVLGESPANVGCATSSGRDTTLVSDEQGGLRVHFFSFSICINKKKKQDCNYFPANDLTLILYSNVSLPASKCETSGDLDRDMTFFFYYL